MRKVLLVIAILAGISAVIAAVVIIPRRSRQARITVVEEPKKQRRVGPLTLSDVRSVFVEPMTMNGMSGVSNPGLKYMLSEGNLVTIVETKEEADAILHLTEITVSTDNTKVYRTGPIARVWTRDTKADVEATLRDARSDATLWTAKKSKTVSGRQYGGDLNNELIEQLKADLVKSRSEKP
jgi:hypothetical protein